MRPFPTSLVPRALGYIKDRLARGRALANLVLTFVRLDKGTVFCSLPPTVPVESMSDFCSGGKLAESAGPPILCPDPQRRRIVIVPRPSTNNVLADFLNTYLKSETPRLCVFEDVLSRPTDPVVKSDPRIVASRDECYFVVSAAAFSLEALEQTIRDADALWYFMCMGVPTPASTAFLGSRQFSSEDLPALARRADWLAVGAYDGEGFVVWERGDDESVQAEPTQEQRQPTT